MDLLPTFLEIAGVELPEGFVPDGQSAASAFMGKGFNRTKPIFWEWRGGISKDYTWPTLGIRDGRWKLLVNKEQKRMELYDLKSDWAEKRNVAAGNPKVAQQLFRKLDVWKSTWQGAPDKTCLSKARKKLSK